MLYLLLFRLYRMKFISQDKIFTNMNILFDIIFGMCYIIFRKINNIFKKGSDIVERAYKYRIYPNKEQQELIQKTFGCCRFVYNYYLNERKELYMIK